MDALPSVRRRPCERTFVLCSGRGRLADPGAGREPSPVDRHAPAGSAGTEPGRGARTPQPARRGAARAAAAGPGRVATKAGAFAAFSRLLSRPLAVGASLDRPLRGELLAASPGDGQGRREPDSARTGGSPAFRASPCAPSMWRIGPGVNRRSESRPLFGATWRRDRSDHASYSKSRSRLLGRLVEALRELRRRDAAG